MEEVEQRKREAESKEVALARVLDEACRSLPDFDMQAEEEPEKRVVRLKDYAQQSRSLIEKMKAEHEAQITELQLRIIPESPPEVREQRRRDIQASAMKILDLVSSASKLLAKVSRPGKTCRTTQKSKSCKKPSSNDRQRWM